MRMALIDNGIDGDRFGARSLGARFVLAFPEKKMVSEHFCAVLLFEALLRFRAQNVL